MRLEFMQTNENQTLRVPRRKIKCAEGENAAPKEVELIRCGTFHHPQYGKFDITPATLLSFKKNFDDNVRGVDLAVDYKHDSDNIAAGWIKGVVLKEDGKSLWIDTAWTPNGNKVLADKEFRYISADFQMDYKDNESLKSFGPTLMGAGLTNRPVVKKMEPVIELSEGKGDIMDPKDKQIADLQAKCSELQGKLDEFMKKQDPAAPPPGSEVELAAAKKGMQDAQDQVKALSEKIALSEKTSTFDKMLTEGKVVEAQREHFMKGDFAKFSESAQPVSLKTKGSGTDLPPEQVDPKDANEAQDAVLKLAEEKIKGNNKLDRKQAINLVLAENKELAAKI